MDHELNFEKLFDICSCKCKGICNMHDAGSRSNLNNH